MITNNSRHSTFAIFHYNRRRYREVRACVMMKTAEALGNARPRTFGRENSKTGHLKASKDTCASAFKTEISGSFSPDFCVIIKFALAVTLNE